MLLDFFELARLCGFLILLANTYKQITTCDNQINSRMSAMFPFMNSQVPASGANLNKHGLQIHAKEASVRPLFHRMVNLRIIGKHSHFRL